MGGDRAYLAPEPFGPRGKWGYSTNDLDEWAKGFRAAGFGFLRNQPAYNFIQDGLDIINGDFMPGNNEALSDMKIESTYRNTKELVAAQTNIRIIPSFSTNIPEFDDQAAILNKAFMCWQYMISADRCIRRAWQYACVAGTGYLGVRYDPNYHYQGRGNIVLDAYGPLDVMPVGMGDDQNLQKAYGVIHRVRTPIHEAWRLFKTHRDRINASRSGHDPGTVVSKAVQYAQKFLSPALRRWGPGYNRVDESMPWDMVNIYNIYLNDDSFNTTGQEQMMGVPGTTWCYIVPYYRQQITIGTRPKSGTSITKIAMEEDCKLYPNRRLIQCTDDFCLNPDPSLQVSPYWHAQAPLIQFKADDWAWSFLGFPVTRMGSSIEKANTDLGRMVVDASKARLSPPRIYDRAGPIGANVMESMDTRVSNTVLGLDLQMSDIAKQIAPMLPYQHYEYPATTLDFMKENESRIAHQMGVADATALARARQLPSGDSTEKLLSAMGELIKDQSRNMEGSIMLMGQLWQSMFFQFIPPRTRLQWMGEKGLAKEDYDFDPGTLIPDSLDPNDDKYQDINPAPLSRLVLDMEPREGGYYFSGGATVNKFERARWHKGNFTYTVEPYSMHEINSMTRKLFFLQLKKSGFPLDWWTEAKLFDVNDFGPPPMYDDPEEGPREPKNIMEKWLTQQQILAHIQSGMQGGQPGQGKQKGRPSSGQQPPTMEQKSGAGGTRSTIRESKH